MFQSERPLVTRILNHPEIVEIQIQRRMCMRRAIISFVTQQQQQCARAEMQRAAPRKAAKSRHSAMLVTAWLLMVVTQFIL